LIIEPETGLILNANDAAAKFYGYSKSVLRSMTINEINRLSPELFLMFGLDPEQDIATFDNWDKTMHPHDKELAYSKLNDSIKNHTQLNNEYRVVHPDGNELWINAIGNTTYNGDGKPIRNAGICIDISERKSWRRCCNLIYLSKINIT
jgi:PAS domain S-box-containing protein